jgi:transposase-like protein
LYCFSRKPPYCPNPKCVHHQSFLWSAWIKKGTALTKKAPGINFKYKCKTCGRNFSSNCFKLDYRHRKIDLFEEVFKSSSQGLSNRSIARNLNVAENTVRNRIKHLSRQSLIRWEQFASHIKLSEAIAYDGFETFVYSQYDPNNINHAVGRNSLYLYDFSYSHLNRKGRMTSEQRKKMQKLDRKKGRYPTNRIRVQSLVVFNYLSSINKSSLPIELYTDEHKIYKLVLKKDMPNHNLHHHTINSKKPRTTANPLFPINHLDMKLRHFLKSCTRETIGFNKNEMGLIDRYVLFAIQKNFLRSKFIKGKKETLTHSPAMIVGIANKIYSFKEFFRIRRTRFQVDLRQEWLKYYNRQIDHSRLSCQAYLGI